MSEFVLHPDAVKDHPQKERARLISQPGSYLCRQLPTLPHTFACSTIGPAGLNYRVRDGNGWIPRGMITDVLSSFWLGSSWLLSLAVLEHVCALIPQQLAAANL